MHPPAYCFSRRCFQFFLDDCAMPVLKSVVDLSIVLDETAGLGWIYRFHRWRVRESRYPQLVFYGDMFL